jgi:N-acyl-D-amino-acid deacylase
LVATPEEIKMSEYDLVIRGGLVIDGSGQAGFKADVAVKDGLIVKVGEVSGAGAEEIDATGKIVTPGFVDVHTHYDGQVTWETRLDPSANHGATTVITGNCGVGFAPCRPGDREKLIKVMEGVEDIPELVMAEGLPWNWETFPEYMDAIDARQFDVDVGVQIPHSPIRVYVMGDRALRREVSTDEDRRRMTELVAEGIKAGAIGVTTSRSLNHRAKDGTPAPSVQTDDEEVLALARGLDLAKAGVFQLIPDHYVPPEQEMRFIRRLAKTAGRPVSFSVVQVHEDPEYWRGLLEGIAEANKDGLEVRGQVIGRPVGAMLGLNLSFSPLSHLPSYIAIADKPLAERVAIMRDPAFKKKMLAEDPVIDPQPIRNRLIREAPNMFLMPEKAEYFPRPEASVGEMARKAGVTPMEMAYDLLLGDEGNAVLCLPSANFADKNLDAVYAMMIDEHSVPGLGDGGAHYGVICDASYTTHMLSFWTKEAPRDKRVSLEWAVHWISRKAAETVGLMDRGLVAKGMKADLNVIDEDRLALYAPRAVYDLPSGGRRMFQKSDGYVATIVSGQVTRRNGERTGALPGRLVRGSGYQPAA